jgi:hypothetical protein
VSAMDCAPMVRIRALLKSAFRNVLNAIPPHAEYGNGGRAALRTQAYSKFTFYGILVA